MYEIEVTAPVGSFESLQAALEAGADSVYFGVGELNMRSASTTNFTPQELPYIVKKTKEHNAKAYLTLNVVIYEEELENAFDLLQKAKDAGVDAIIATDYSVLSKTRELKMPVHLSTQTNITNSEAVRFYSQWADVVILSRELSLEQINKIHTRIHKEKILGPSGKPIRLEAFVHGAFCMAISGKCYLSKDLHNQSANRGKCLQVCRRKYKLFDEERNIELEMENGYILSARDLCTLSFLDKIINAGISILKIEGRGRSAEYVYTTVKVYKEAVKAIQSNTFNQDFIKYGLEQLSKVYHRQFWEGYYLGRTTIEWSNQPGSASTEYKEYVGKVTHYYSQLNVAEIKAETMPVYVGAEIYIIGPTTGVVRTTISELHTDVGPSSSASQGTIFSIKVPVKVRRNDQVFIIKQR
ncbi:MAG: U32 family peptidase [Bacteroidales bacterium]|nr:U32 family peptidase [Bacteroidales bacterium]